MTDNSLQHTTPHGHDEAMWISLSDMMTGLMLIFMLLALVFLLRVGSGAFSPVYINSTNAASQGVDTVANMASAASAKSASNASKQARSLSSTPSAAIQLQTVSLATQPSAALPAGNVINVAAITDPAATKALQAAVMDPAAYKKLQAAVDPSIIKAVQAAVADPAILKALQDSAANDQSVATPMHHNHGAHHHHVVVSSPSDGICEPKITLNTQAQPVLAANTLPVTQ